jgi:lysophospholipase L1-like esterase
MRAKATVLFAALAFVSLSAQQVSPVAPLQTVPSCPELATALTSLARNDARQRDWPGLARYREQNRLLSPAGPGQSRVVFMGDSITDGWRLEEAFPGKPFVNRGISGQTTAQMLVRMYPDVIALEPAAVIVLAGTNDVARNNGPQTLEMIQQNIRAMTELARGHDIKVILSAVMPISDTTIAVGRGGRANGPRIQSIQRPPADILRLNDWLESYAAEMGAVYADYYTAVVDEQGFFRAGLTNDGLHPNADGYALMNPVATAAIEQALGRP